MLFSGWKHLYFLAMVRFVLKNTYLQLLALLPNCTTTLFFSCFEVEWGHSKRGTWNPFNEVMFDIQDICRDT